MISKMFGARNRRGVAAVELALIAPVFILIVYGAIDFSRGYFVQAALSAAVRDGARYAAKLETPAGSERNLVKMRVRSALASSLPGVTLDTTLVTVTPADSSADSVRVTVSNFPVTMITAVRLLSGLSGRTTTITRSASFRHQTIR